MRMKKTPYLMLTCMMVTAVFLLQACKSKSAESKTDSEIRNIVEKAPGINAGTGTFQITPPPGWEKMDTSLGGLKLTYLFEPLTPGMQFRTNLVVVTEALNKASLEDYFNNNRKNMSRMMQNFREKGIGIEEMNGEEVRWMDYSHTAAGQEIDVRVYVMAKNNIAYVLTCTTQKGQQGKYEKEFKEALASLKI